MAEGRERQPHPISIHALREEGDGFDQQTGKELTQFLSTPSARRATVFSALSSRPLYNFYPRPPRGGRPAANETELVAVIFLSTPSARRATLCAGSDRR